MNLSLTEAYRELVVGDAERMSAAWQFCQQLPGQALQGRVGITLEDPLWFALSFLKVLEEGGTPVVMPDRHECDSLGLHALIESSGWQPLRGDEPGRVGHYVAFSSGSTGRRKPLWFSLERGRANARAHAQALHMTPAHRLIQTLKIHHSFGLIAYIFAPLECGVPVELGIFFDSLLPQLRESELPHHLLHLTPYHLQFLRRRGVQVPHRLGTLTVGAGPLRRGEAQYAHSLCRQLYATYGLSEAGPRVSCGRVELENFVDGWIGWPLNGVEIRLDADSGLWLRTPYRAEVELSPDGFLETGDAAELAGDGSLIFCCRRHDVIRLRGQTYPRGFYENKIEALLELPAALGQLPYSDDLVVFLESEHADPALELKLGRALPELREAQVLWCPSFLRSSLGKPDVPRMLERWKAPA